MEGNECFGGVGDQHSEPLHVDVDLSWHYIFGILVNILKSLYHVHFLDLLALLSRHDFTALEPVL
jgi:hypothetical protein